MISLLLITITLLACNEKRLDTAVCECTDTGEECECE